ncbi:MAG: hypothetical protein LBS27_10325 [Bifidobacteriaceae bacterium]|nr:hypothetical protein [Bifidobacteriaceae bacterium]
MTGRRGLIALAPLCGLALLAGCGRDAPPGFDSEAYCQAIAKPAVELNAKAMIEGDEQALKDAESVYENLQALAPASLDDEWTVILRELGSMIDAASGSISAEDVDAQAFTDAFTAIEMDKRERCLQ